MANQITVLHIDDSAEDHKKVFQSLAVQSMEFKVSRISSLPDTNSALSGKLYDVIICGINKPGLQNLDIIDLARRFAPHAPIIILAGAGSEELAVEAMKRGAADYRTKTDEHIGQLPSIINKAVGDWSLPEYHLTSHGRFQQNQDRYQALFDDSPVPIWEEEFSELFSYLETLKVQGISDFRSYFETFPHELTVCANKIKILDVNKAAVALHQARNKEHLVSNLASTFTENSFSVFKEEVLALASGQMEFESEVEVRTLEGQTRFVYLRLNMYQAKGGTSRALLATTDITHRKAAEEDRQQLMSAMEATRESVVITDSNGIIKYVNPAFEHASGFSRKEAIGRTPGFLKSDEHDSQLYDGILKTLLHGKTWSGRIINRRKDGTLSTEDISISPVLNEMGKTIRYVGIFHDVSSEILLESQLQQAQKLESIGLLAGGVAHDFNNILSVILGNSDLALLELEPEHPARSLLKGIQSAAQRSADLTSQLLAFARQQTIIPVVLDLNDAVEGILNMMRRLIGEDIDLIWLPGPGTPLVKMDPSQIDQIMANLCVNARDAINGVGKVTVETSLVEINEEYCSIHPGFIPGKFVVLAISDNGQGMTRETLDRIFEPFFSTKSQNEGTGLGLATVYGIIKQNGGFINSYSEPGRGTTFRLYLSRVTDARAKAPVEESKEPVPGGNEIILLVEDEPTILELATRILRGRGYCVLPVDNPMEAIKVVKGHPVRIDLVLTDVILPDMSGNDLVGELNRLDPKISHLFMSGYTANMISEHGVLDEKEAFLQKPFSKLELERTVRKVLDERLRHEECSW